MTHNLDSISQFGVASVPANTDQRAGSPVLLCVLCGSGFSV